MENGEEEIVGHGVNVGTEMHLNVSIIMTHLLYNNFLI